jgi:hypothetical protein
LDSLFSHQRPSHDPSLRCAGALAANAQACFRLRALHLEPVAAPVRHFGWPSDWFSGASDRSGRTASEGATVCIAISSKMNGMRAKGWAFRGLARMLLNYP